MPREGAEHPSYFSSFLSVIDTTLSILYTDISMESIIII